MNDERFWSKYADKFDELNEYVIGKEDMQIITDQISKLTNLGDVLELACGSGIYTRILCNNCDSILATDYSNAMVEHSKNKFSSTRNIKVEQANAMDLQYEPESFDTIFMANLLHIVPDYDKVINNAYRVLKPKGRIVTLDFTSSGMNIFNMMILVYKFIKAYGMPDEKAKKTQFSPSDIKELFERYNLQTEDVRILGRKNKAVLGVGIKL